MKAQAESPGSGYVTRQEFERTIAKLVEQNVQSVRAVESFFSEQLLRQDCVIWVQGQVLEEMAKQENPTTSLDRFRTFVREKIDEYEKRHEEAVRAQVEEQLPRKAKQEDSFVIEEPG